ncbi:LacI family DNA-binding transcriptional regulator [Paeniglutamicibacter psychrophenolicus]|uniref:DNA-binding LacI/PurR family transcriptional regulator n=1 Tax=Paeniglutamicibacter psychrophenolicus TaxID=257454 RepID=A0ABS4WCL5_9MICC|nr:LacI family DNA-binding transcriptional regulator [Paeniglutamicibacter psychrophenolicus]MBP2373900.1 DNA-binding LacI/PurR family transcriptional regulator [Paeniglutamicibacter psychrophenolicus]
MVQKPSRAPSMRDVAQLAGVSAQTVSRVLSDHPNVQPETRQAVREAARSLGYRRNATARALVTGRSNMLGVITLSSSSYSRMTLIVGIEREAAARGYSVTFVSITDLSARSLEEGLSRLVAQGVDGIITAVPLQGSSAEVESLLNEVPSVAIDSPLPAGQQVVAFDQVHAARLAVEHLIERGHTNIWHVAGPKDWVESDARITGWRDALESAGLQVPPEIYGDWSAASGYRAGLILGRMPDVTAVFVASDEMAFGLIKAVTELGRAVPRDISVVGIDDIELAPYCTPPLTTVRQPLEEIGRHAVQQLDSELGEHEESEPRNQTRFITPELIVRSSTSTR